MVFGLKDVKRARTVAVGGIRVAASEFLVIRNDMPIEMS
jgi:hypothetical protein